MPLVGIPNASQFLTGGFMAMGIALATLLVIGVHFAGRRLGESPGTTRRWTMLTAIGAGAWLGVTWAAAETGHLSRLDLRPPPFLALPVAIAVLGVLMAFTRFGTRLVDGLPLAALIGVQAFRFPLELLMHRAYSEGVMPYQMSYSGWNFDIVTGLTALPVAWAIHRGARRPPPGRCVERAWRAAAAQHRRHRRRLDADRRDVRPGAAEHVRDVPAVCVAAGGDGVDGVHRPPARRTRAATPSSYVGRNS